MGTQAFSMAARAGDTVTIAVNRLDNVSRDNVTIAIRDSAGAVTTYGPSDSRVLAVFNLYPDPISSLVYYDIVFPGLGTAGTATSNSGGDKDWWQTAVFLDLPSSMALGDATVSLTSTTGASVGPINVAILPGAGTANQLVGTTPTGPFPTRGILPQLERVSHKTVMLSGTTIPNAVQLVLTHANSLAGDKNLAVAMNPRSDEFAMTWRDDGTTMSVIMMAPIGKTPGETKHYRFYVAGAGTLAVSSVKAVDGNGVPISGVTATIQ